MVMRVLLYDIRPWDWAACKLLRPAWPGVVATRLGGLSLRDVPPPALPGDDWVRLRTLLGGICGTDLAILSKKQRPDSILQAFSSMPMVLGHENVAVVDEVGPAVDPCWKGRRVCVEPTLNCEVRGIVPPCGRCAEGAFGACENFGSAGAGRYGLPAGTSIGYNSRTGGSFGEQFVAHVSQLVPVPDDVSDTQAVLTDPVACGLHSLLRADWASARKICVYGAGMLGLAVVASARAMGYDGQLDVIARGAYSATLAGELGADRVLRLPPGRAKRFAAVAERTGGRTHRIRLGNWMLSGGYDVTFDCVGSRQSMEECLKWTRARGQVVLVGTGDGGGADMTALWFRELSVLGAYGRQLESVGGERLGTYSLVHRLMQQGRLKVSHLLTHTFRLNDYRSALAVAMDKSAHRAVRVAFDFR